MQKRNFRNDIILVAVIAVLVLAMVLIFSITQKEGKYVAVTVDGDLMTEYSLDTDITVPIFTDSNKYENLLVIKDGVAFISEANCPDKICVEHRPISKTGETIVCLPHKLVVSVEVD